MHTVIKGTKTVEEFKKKQEELENLAQKAYESHKMFCEDWRYGEPVKVWNEEGSEVCVQYESGKYWHYKDLDLPFPMWW